LAFHSEKTGASGGKKGGRVRAPGEGTLFRKKCSPTTYTGPNQNGGGCAIRQSAGEGDNHYHLWQETSRNHSFFMGKKEEEMTHQPYLGKIGVIIFSPSWKEKDHERGKKRKGRKTEKKKKKVRINSSYCRRKKRTLPHALKKVLQHLVFQAVKKKSTILQSRGSRGE